MAPLPSGFGAATTGRIGAYAGSRTGAVLQPASATAVNASIIKEKSRFIISSTCC